MSIFDNTVVGLKLKGVRKKSILQEKAELCLRQSGLWEEVKDKLNSPGTGLSGGQQQRLCIARTLAVNPPVLLMDEPTSALDPIATTKIEELMMELKKNYTIIVITHNIQQASRIADYTSFFILGELIEHSKTSQIFTNPKHQKQKITLPAGLARGEQIMSLGSEFLRHKIIEMGKIVREVLHISYNNQESLETVLSLEDQINRKHIAIDDDIFKYIALQKPAATDLRLALAAMKINAELERIGDQSLIIKRYSQRIQKPVSKLDNIDKLASSMFEKSLESFAQDKVRMARDILHRDREVNEINRDIVEETLSQIKEQEVGSKEGFAIIRVAKNFERIGDLSTNIAEAVIFIVSGRDIRHNREEK